MSGSFDEWYVRNHAAVLSSLTVISGDREVARDATDEAFARACERWDRVSTMASPGGWVYRTGLNVLKRRGRRAAIERRLLRRVDPGELAAPDLWSVEVLDAIRSLPMRERVATTLRYVADLSTDQIAEVMNVAPGTISATLHSARRRLAAALGDEPEPPIEIELEGVRDANS